MKTYATRSTASYQMAVFYLLVVGLMLVMPHSLLAQSNTLRNGNMFQAPDTTGAGGGIFYGVLEVMRWIFSILYGVAVYYLIKAGRNYSEENYDKMWANIGATVFYTLIPTVAHVIWAIGDRASAPAMNTGT